MPSPEQRAASLPRMAFWATGTALLVLALALSVLTGWTLRIDLLKSLWPASPAMKPITAVCFTLSAVSLLQRAPWADRLPPGAGTAAAGMVIVLTGATLLEYITGVDLLVDRILFFEDVAMPGTIPGRMSAMSAVSFIVFATARLIVDTRNDKAQGLFVVLTLAGLVQAYLVIIGHAYDAPLLYNPLPATSVAPVTATASLLLFVGVSLLRPDLGWPARVTSAMPSGSFVRKTVAAIVLGVPLIGWFRLEGQEAGYYDYRTGSALFATASIFFLIAIIWVAARNADRMDSRRLESKVRQQDALIRFGAETLQAQTVDELCRQTVSRVCEGLEAGFASISEIDVRTGHIRSHVFVQGEGHSTTEWMLADIPAGSAFHHILETGKELVLHDLARTKEFNFTYAHVKRMKSGILLPLAGRGATRCVLMVFFPEVRAFDTDEREFLAVITNMLDVANERLSLSFSLQQKNTALIRADRAKSDFLARMSHELRTPMTGVLGIADLLLMGEMNDNQRELTRSLMRSARMLLDLLNDILDFSKIEAGQMEIDNAPFRVSTIVEDIGKLFGPLASEKGLRLDTVGPSPEYDGVIGDPKRLRQILANLVNNAIKFTPHGQIVVMVDLDGNASGRVTLKGSVADTGIGIDITTIDRLFLPFSQADASTSRKYGGTGLGLAITKSFVTAMGGTITATSTLGEGATFRFTIPLAADPAYVPGSIADQDTSGDVAQTLLNLRTRYPRRILLAEDNETSRLLVSTMLQRIGHTVEAVENGAKAVTTYLKHRHDIILMDMQMPVMDGPEAMKIIRSGGEGKGRHVPIIALTADILTNNKQGYLEAGANIVMGKPVDWLALAAEIDRRTGGSMDTVVAAAPRGTPFAESSETDDDALIDTKMLRELRAVVGDAQVEKLRTSFLSGLAEGEDELEAAVLSGDMTRIKRAAHAVKGLAAQYGATRASRIAKRIEADATSLDEMAPLLTAFKETAAATRAALAEIHDGRATAR